MATSKGAFCYVNYAKTATITGSSTTPVAGLEWARVQDAQPSVRARVAATSAALVFDLGAAQSIEVAALISTSIPAAGTCRVRGHTADSWAGATDYDSGVLSTVTDPAYNGNIVHVLSSAVSKRYWRFDIASASNPIDVGMAILGPLFQPSRNFSFGFQRGRKDLGERRRNEDTGSHFTIDGPKPRVRQFTYQGLTDTEARSYLDAMERVAGAANDVLFIENPNASAIVRSAESIYGPFREPGAAVAQRNAYNVYARSFVMEERF